MALGAYVAAVFKGEGLLSIGPNISVAGKVATQVRKRLPCEHYSPVVRAVQKSPMHGLRLADSGCAEQILHGGLGRHHMHVWVAVSRDKVHVRELKRWRQS